MKPIAPVCDEDFEFVHRAVHELSHAYTALRCGYSIERIQVTDGGELVLVDHDNFEFDDEESVVVYAAGHVGTVWWQERFDIASDLREAEAWSRRQSADDFAIVDTARAALGISESDALKMSAKVLEPDFEHVLHRAPVLAEKGVMLEHELH